MATLTSFDNANRADSTPLSIFLFCLCLCGFSAANETWIENATEPGEPEMAGSSRIPTESRILDGGGSSSKSLNFTSFVTIDSKYQVEEDEPGAAAASTTLRCPSSSSENTDFRPSVHIGEIDEYESRKSDHLAKHPFDNKASVNNNRIKFDNTLRIDETAVDNDGVRVPTSSSRNGVSIGAGTNKIPVKFFETDGRYSFVVPVDLVHHHQQQQEHYEPQYLQISGHQQQQQNDHTDQAENDNDDSEMSHEPSHQQHSPVTFEYPGGLPAVAVYGTPSPHLTLLRPLNSPIIKESSPVHYHQQLHPQQQQQQYTTVPHLADNLSPVLLKPTKLYDNVVVNPSVSNNLRYQHYQYAPAIASGEAIEKPEIPSFQHPPAVPSTNYHSLDNNNNNQAIFTHDDESHHNGKPDTLYYVTSHHESAVTRMRKFPYKFYDPSLVGQHDDQFHFSLQELQPNYPSKERRVSPWKKIIHLIGAFLPLGLLLATLKPNVVKIENTTQPNIILSKLRVIDLPAEHKRGRLVDKVDECDDRSICELIVSGSQPSSNLLQNILWNFTNRSTEEEAQKHGLREIFAAAKKKDCSLIDC